MRTRDAPAPTRVDLPDVWEYVVVVFVADACGLRGDDDVGPARSLCSARELAEGLINVASCCYKAARTVQRVLDGLHVARRDGDPCAVARCLRESVRGMREYLDRREATDGEEVTPFLSGWEEAAEYEECLTTFKRVESAQRDRAEAIATFEAMARSVDVRARAAKATERALERALGTERIPGELKRATRRAVRRRWTVELARWTKSWTDVPDFVSGAYLDWTDRGRGERRLRSANANASDSYAWSANRWTVAEALLGGSSTGIAEDEDSRRSAARDRICEEFARVVLAERRTRSLASERKREDE